MNTSGCLRRVAILPAFAWAFSFFVLKDGQWIAGEEQREWLRWLLYGAVAWGIVTLFADRKGSGPSE